MHKVIADKKGGVRVPLDKDKAKALEKEWQANEIEANKQAKIDARREAYGPVGDQLDMMYWDQVNGTEKWKDHIAHVKATMPVES